MDFSNYSSFSLLSLFNNWLFEKVMYNKLKSCVELNGFLYNGQYGFREKMSTQHAILDIVNSIQSRHHAKSVTVVNSNICLERAPIKSSPIF